MKTLKGLNEPIKTIKMPNDPVDLHIPTVRDVILTTVANNRSVTGPGTVRLTRMGLAFLVANETMELEDADFEILKEVFKSATPYTSFVTGQVNMILEEAEKEKK